MNEYARESRRYGNTPCAQARAIGRGRSMKWLLGATVCECACLHALSIAEPAPRVTYPRTGLFRRKRRGRQRLRARAVNPVTPQAPIQDRQECLSHLARTPNHTPLLPPATRRTTCFAKSLNVTALG